MIFPLSLIWLLIDIEPWGTHVFLNVLAVADDKSPPPSRRKDTNNDPLKTANTKLLHRRNSQDPIKLGNVTNTFCIDINHICIACLTFWQQFTGRRSLVPSSSLDSLDSRSKIAEGRREGGRRSNSSCDQTEKVSNTGRSPDLRIRQQPPLRISLQAGRRSVSQMT